MLSSKIGSQILIITQHATLKANRISRAPKFLDAAQVQLLIEELHDSSTSQEDTAHLMELLSACAPPDVNETIYVKSNFQCILNNWGLRAPILIRDFEVKIGVRALKKNDCTLLLLMLYVLLVAWQSLNSTAGSCISTHT